MIRTLARPAMATVAALAAMAATAPSVGAAPAAHAARQLVWQPTYLAHVTSGWILSATAPADKAAWAVGPGVDQFGISGAAVISTTDVWVVAGGNVSHWNGHGWTTTTVPAGYSDEEISGYRGNVWIVSAAPDTGTHVAFRLVGAAWHAAALPRIAKIKVVRLVVASSGVWLAVAGSKTVTLHLSGGRWHQLANPGAYLPIPLATYGRAGLWDDPGDVWTGRQWIGVSYEGHSMLPTALTSVPGSTSAWLFGNTLNGPEVLRAVWQ